MQIFQDLKYSLRLLRNTPAFTAMTLVVIVLGLSLYLASYTFTTQIAEEPMPFPQGDRFVTLGSVDLQSGTMLQQSTHDKFSYQRLLENTTSYSVLGAYSRATSILDGGDYAQRFTEVSMMPNLMAATATNPILGRIFTSDDVASDGDDVILISYTLWQAYYQGREDIVGKLAQVGGQPARIIGVMPEGFRFPRGADFWSPMRISAGAAPAEEPVSLVGILAADANYVSAELELNTAMKSIIAENPEYDTNRSERVYSYAALYPWGMSLPDILNYVAWIVLALAVVNLSSLLFIRSSARRQELTVRSSLGASAWQLVRQVLTESFVICSIGFLLSLLISAFLLQMLKIAWGVDLPYWVDFQLSYRGVAVAAFVTLIIWLVSGLAVSHRAFRSKPQDVLNSAGAEVAGKGKREGAQLIVAVEVILSCFLLVCCGAAVYLFALASETSYGVSTDNSIVASYSFSSEEYDDSLKRGQYIENLNRGIEQLPGVIGVVATTALPHRVGARGRYELEDYAPANSQQGFRQSTISISNNYFSTMGVAPLIGRDFDASDTADSIAVTIITDRFAQQLWPDEPAIGKRIKSIAQGEEQWLTVVGVIPFILQSAYDFEAMPSLYRPLAQDSQANYFLVATHEVALDADELEAGIKDVANTLDRRMPLENIRSLEAQMARDLSGVGGFGLLFIEFTLATVLLACIGIYTVIARSIYMRTREIGIRRALGSSDNRLVVRFIKKAIKFLFAGILLGAAPAVFVSVLGFSSLAPIGNQAIEALPSISLIVVLMISFMVIVASYIPARRAISLEPGDALRYE